MDSSCTSNYCIWNSVLTIFNKGELTMKKKHYEFSFILVCTKDQADALLEHLEEVYGTDCMPSYNPVKEIDDEKKEG